MRRRDTAAWFARYQDYRLELVRNIYADAVRQLKARKVVPLRVQEDQRLEKLMFKGFSKFQKQEIRCAKLSHKVEDAFKRRMEPVEQAYADALAFHSVKFTSLSLRRLARAHEAVERMHRDAEEVRNRAFRRCMRPMLPEGLQGLSLGLNRRRSSGIHPTGRARAGRG